MLPIVSKTNERVKAMMQLGDEGRKCALGSSCRGWGRFPFFFVFFSVTSRIGLSR